MFVLPSKTHTHIYTHTHTRRKGKSGSAGRFSCFAADSLGPSTFKGIEKLKGCDKENAYEFDLRKDFFAGRRATMGLDGDSRTDHEQIDGFLAGLAGKGITNLSLSVSFASNKERLHKVSELMSQDGAHWDSDLVTQTFKPKEAKLILAIPLTRQGHRDSIIWNPHKHGLFTVKSAYSLILKSKLSRVQFPE
ncbi:Protein kinase superfamily protein [Striga hermonthica]|uniref:Protein kinase superfamily protein n=1 Tax=Striga hermonthica TaxID=68872 RepID=A0A9N7MZC2_STRHE|nr:Protein kinase superfamily protein [Striga hermonthica]